MTNTAAIIRAIQESFQQIMNADPQEQRRLQRLCLQEMPVFRASEGGF